MSLKEELDHDVTNILGLTCKDRLHACTNECLNQCSQMFVIKIENIACDRLFWILHYHEIKLRKINFELEGKLETLNENQIQLILQLRDYVNNCCQNDIYIHAYYPILHDTKHDVDNFKIISSNYLIHLNTPDELINNS